MSLYCMNHADERFIMEPSAWSSEMMLGQWSIISHNASEIIGVYHDIQYTYVVQYCIVQYDTVELL